MTTTAHEDQFTDAPESVRQTYSTADILRRNVADLEIALKQQTERAEAADEKLTTAREDMQSWIDSRNGWMERAGAAEAELAKLRKQKPVAYRIDWPLGLQELGWQSDSYDEDYVQSRGLPNVVPLYAAPVHAVPAPAVPYGVDEEAANRIALTVYDCKNGINPEPLLYAINRILATEAHPLSEEGQRALLQSAEVHHD